MNTTTLQNRHHQTRIPQFGGNSVTESESTRSRNCSTDTWRRGLRDGDAWDAALARLRERF